MSKFHVKKQFNINHKTYSYYKVKELEKYGLGKLSRLPYSIRVLTESLLRQHDHHTIKDEHITNLFNWNRSNRENLNIPFKPSRVILQDLSGAPAMIDLASMRKAIMDAGKSSGKVNPVVPVDLVIDHSVQVDHFGSNHAFQANEELEFSRNKERYDFLHWAQKSFDNYRVVPPSTGIIHQVNLEYLASVVLAEKKENGVYEAFPDTLIGTDSHTTMINGLGVLGWGVGGIEAEAGMLGHPSYFPIPDVIGVKFVGSLSKGVTTTDLALKVTQVLREKNVVGKFVEYFGPGLKDLTIDERATIANMAPEYGATCGFFPIDEKTLDYLRLTGREKEQIDLVERYCKENDLWYSEELVTPEYTDIVEINLTKIEPTIAGPKRPQDLISLSNAQKEFQRSITAPLGNDGFGLNNTELEKEISIKRNDGSVAKLNTGSIVLAAITSCTNTSNPYVMLTAGLLAKKAVEKGLQVPWYVKTSLAPGSKVVTRYLVESGLMKYLEKLGFHLVGYGCTTCSGNSGPLIKEVEQAIESDDLLVCSILSGNRNFEARIHPQIKASYLASPPLVVAYALTGSLNKDIINEPLGIGNKDSVYLKDIWPSTEEVEKLMKQVIAPEMFKSEYEHLFDSNEKWNQIVTTDDPVFNWNEDSTYIKNPPFFKEKLTEVKHIEPLNNLRVIGKFGDSLTTDHISPVGAIPKDMPAGRYLQDIGISPRDFNTYGARRGNHEVMIRGTFSNIRIRNLIVPEIEGGYTKYWPTGEIMPIYDAAMKYQKADTGLVVIGGKDYGMGSSRDWAAKGTKLLGIRAVIAESYERIHRSNLVMMGVLPLMFEEGESADKLKLTGEETFHIEIDENIRPLDIVKVIAVDQKGNSTKFNAIACFDNEIEIDYYRYGGILQMVLHEKIV